MKTTDTPAAPRARRRAWVAPKVAVMKAGAAEAGADGLGDDFVNYS